VILGGRCDCAVFCVWFAILISIRFSEGAFPFGSYVAGSGAGGVTVTTGEAALFLADSNFFIGEVALNAAEVNLNLGEVGVVFLSASFHEPDISFVSVATGVVGVRVNGVMT
jgi:hypothetical protein